MLGKILVAIVLLVGVLWLMGMVRRVGVARDTAARRDALSQQHRTRKAEKRSEDLVRCPTCGAYHADGLGHRCEG